MSNVFYYHCPNCQQEVSVEELFAGTDVVCPCCQKVFFATPPEPSSEVSLPKKLPFFKWGRKKLLDEKLKDLVADGELSAQDSRTLSEMTNLLGLKESEIEDITRKAFLSEFNQILKRMAKVSSISSEDCSCLEKLKTKYGIKAFTTSDNLPERKSLIKLKLQDLVFDGELSGQDEEELEKLADLLLLEKLEVSAVVKESFLSEFRVIQNRIERAWVMTDEDCNEIEYLKKKYGVKHLTLEGNADMFRMTYLLENKGQLPPPLLAEVMLDSKETAYFSANSTWQQTRVHRRGYSGSSMSIPTGIKGVNFRFGQYTPVRSEEITPLASGCLYITSKRLIFHGDARSTKVDHKKILNTEIFSDALKIDKLTGKPDYFSMNPGQARFASALISHFKEI